MKEVLEIDNLQFLTENECLSIDGGHITLDTSWGHDVGYVVGLAVRAQMAFVTAGASEICRWF